jgi:hypothetical protein
MRAIDQQTQQPNDRSTPSAGVTRFLHVANGKATTAIIKGARIPGALSEWGDPLYEGPVPEEASDEELVRIRAQYLADGIRESVDDVVAGLTRWRTLIDDVGAYDELVLWYEHDLFDQLNLIQLLTWIGRSGPTQRHVSLICIGSFPGRPTFKGLGELTPGELAPLFDTRQPVEDAEYKLARQAWQAFRSSDPRAIEEMLQHDTSALPFLAPALRRYLEEFPWTTDGLSRSERRLLELSDNGPIDLRQAFPRMHDGETAFYVTDGLLEQMAQDLSSTSPPLLNADFAPGESRYSLHGTVSLTDAGRALLEGKQDRIRQCGIDRWLGGVHLQAATNVWRWDPTNTRLKKNPEP